MKVVEFENSDGTSGCCLVGENGVPVESVMNFLHRNDGIQESTLWKACTYLLSFFTFLEESGKRPEEGSIGDIEGYVRWLVNLESEKQEALFGDSMEDDVKALDKCIDTVLEFLYYEIFA